MEGWRKEGTEGNLKRRNSRIPEEMDTKVPKKGKSKRNGGNDRKWGKMERKL